MPQSSFAVSTVRVGASNNSLAEQLTSAVIGFLNQPADASNCSSSSVLKISNKYFDAHVALKSLTILSEEKHNRTAQIANDGQEDGILLVFEDHSKPSFDVIAELNAKAEANKQNGDLLRLCVGVTTINTTTFMTAKEREVEYARRVLWCLDHGYEYVEKVDLSPEGIQQGHNDREKEAFARVVEAIQGTVWSSAKMHPKKKQTLHESYQKMQQALQESEDHRNSGAYGNAYEPPPTTIPTPAVISDAEAKEREEYAKRVLLQQDGVEITSSLEENVYLDGQAPPSQEERMREQQADKIMSDMEGALKEANRIRDMSRAGELSDEDRKKRAGDAATLILNLMNQMGTLESDSEPENNQRNDNE